MLLGNNAEPSSTAANMFYIGRNSRGAWVVQDQSGLCGGLFIDRAAALRFALFENGQQRQAVLMVPGVLELDMKPGIPLAVFLGRSGKLANMARSAS